MKYLLIISLFFSSLSYGQNTFPIADSLTASKWYYRWRDSMYRVSPPPTFPNPEINKAMREGLSDAPDTLYPAMINEVCRNISDTRKQGWTAQPWPAILWRKADGTYLDHKKHPLKPWIRVWEN